MAAKQPKQIVSTVRRRGDAAPVVAPAKVSAKVARARASHKAALAPLRKSKEASPDAAIPSIERETPVIYKKDAGKTLVERLNMKLLEQLRTRRVTNRAAAEALGVSEIYLSRTLSELGATKVQGATTKHREARAKLDKARSQMRTVLAKKVNRQEMTIEQAAKDANCSVRTMFRWCAKYTKP